MSFHLLFHLLFCFYVGLFCFNSLFYLFYLGLVSLFPQVTAVDARWLAELGPMFFSIRKMGMGGGLLQAEEDAATAGIEQTSPCSV